MSTTTIPAEAGGPPSPNGVPLLELRNIEASYGPFRSLFGISLAVPDLVKTQQWDEIGRRALLASSIIQSRRAETEPHPTYVH